MRDVLASSCIREVRDRVVDRYEVRGAQCERHEIGALARLDRADLRIQAEGARAAERRRAQRRVGGHRPRIARHRLGEEPGSAHLGEEVEPVIARRAVGAEADVYTGTTQRLYWGKTTGQLEVR